MDLRCSTSPEPCRSCSGRSSAWPGPSACIRFPDTLSRLHAATKPQTLGLILILTGLALTLRTWAAVTTLVLLAATQFFTSPVSAHLVGRAAYRNRLRRHRRPSRSTSCPTPSTARAEDPAH